MRRLLPLLAMLFVLSACGGDAEQDAASPTPTEPEANVVELRGDEYAFVMPETIEGGWTSIRFTNTGDEPHEFALAKLTQGKTIEDGLRLLSEATSGPPPEWIEIRAGLPTLDAGETATLTQDLEPGTYALLCFLDAPDGKTHIEHGMVRGFEVRGQSGAPKPEADATLLLGSWKSAPTVPAGESTIELRNDGKRPGSVFLTAFEPGKTEEDLARWERNGLRGPAPAAFLGGTIDVPPRGSVYYTVELEAGREYTLFDDIRGISGEFVPRG